MKALAQKALTLLVFGGLLVWMFSGRFAHSPLMDEPAPDFVLPVVLGEGASEGDRLRLSDLKGQVVVLDFWASWCGPCREIVPDLSALAEKFADRDVRFIGINSEAIAPPTYEAIGAAWGFKYPILKDGQARAHLAYKINAFPSLFVLDRQGIVRYAVAGVPTRARIEREITSLLE